MRKIMKKYIASLTMAGLLIAPSAGLNARTIDKEDLQAISSNKMENKAWQNGQRILSVLATLTAIGTGFFLVDGISLASKHEIDKANISLLLSGVTGLATACLGIGWYKVVKKRMKKHGYKSMLKFLFVNALANADKDHR